MNSAIDDPGWLIAGLLMCLAGIWMIRWASRNNMASAIKDATVGAAMEALAKRGRPDMPPEVKAKLAEISAAEGLSGKAKKVASYGVRNSLAQVFGIAGFILFMAGLVTAAIGVFGT
jgi:hypothetical protein